MSSRFASSLLSLVALSAFGCSAPAEADEADESSSSAALTSAFAGGFDPLPAPGCASALAAGIGVTRGIGTPWVLGCDTLQSGDHPIFRWNGAGWSAVPGAATTLSVGVDGVPWVANAAGKAFKWSGASFEPLTAQGCVRQIAASYGNATWALGCDAPTADGSKVYRYTGSAWEEVSGAAKRIAVAPDGTPWAVNAHGAVFKWSGGGFVALQARGCATDIAVERGDRAWIIGCTAVSASGNSIHYLDQSEWRSVPGAATRISVDFYGRPYVADKAGQVYIARTTR